MKKTTFFKTLLVMVGLFVGSSAWGYTTSLKSDYAVAGYKLKAYYDISNENLNNMCPPYVNNQFTYRGGGWGLFNYGSGNRSATVQLPVSKGDILVIEYLQNQGYVTTINSISSCTKNETLTTGNYIVFDVNSDATSLSIEVGRAGNIMAFLVMEVDNDVAIAEYTINYKLSDGTTIKTEKANVAVGTTISVETSFFENGKKYILNDGQETSLTVKAGGSTLDVIVSEAPMYSYTVNAVDAENKVLKELRSGSFYQGETVTTYIPKAFTAEDGTVYETTEATKKTINETTTSVNVIYAKSDITYFFEETDFTLSKDFAQTAEKDFFSNGWGGRLNSNSDGYTKVLKGGNYTLVIAAATVNANQTATMIYGYSLNGESIILGTSKDFKNGSYFNSETIENVIIPDGASFYWVNNTPWTSNLLLDYVSLTRTGDAEISATVTDAGWATLYTPYALDFSEVEGLTAYTATCDGKEVTLTAVENVPANTGVVLNGEAKTYDIPVIANSTTAQGSLEGSATESLAYENFEEGYTYYILTKSGNEVQFNPVTSGTIAAGKAYLKLTETEASKLRVVIEGEATAISGIATEKAENGATYNVAGQLVNDNYKGIVIKNGKKYLNK